MKEIYILVFGIGIILGLGIGIRRLSVKIDELRKDVNEKCFISRDVCTPRKKYPDPILGVSASKFKGRNYVMGKN